MTKAIFRTGSVWAACLLPCLLGFTSAAETVANSPIAYDTPSPALTFGVQEQKVGTWAPAHLSVNGGVQVGQDASACTAALAGTFRWNATTTQVELCNGSAWVTFGKSCTYQYTWREVLRDGQTWTYYGANKIILCINNAPDSSWQFLSYDDCYEDGKYCTPDAALCFYSKEVCS